MVVWKCPECEEMFEDRPDEGTKYELGRWILWLVPIVVNSWVNAMRCAVIRLPQSLSRLGVVVNLIFNVPLLMLSPLIVITLWS